MRDARRALRACVAGRGFALRVACRTTLSHVYLRDTARKQTYGAAAKEPTLLGLSARRATPNDQSRHCAPCFSILRASSDACAACQARVIGSFFFP